jgi:hypothetical protein
MPCAVVHARFEAAAMVVTDVLSSTVMSVLVLAKQVPSSTVSVTV